MIEPPEDGHQAGGTSDFGADRTVGTRPHVGFDMNRGRGTLPHGRVTSPVYGRVKEIDPALGRIVIEEWRDPVSKQPTGYHVEILHTQTQTVTKNEPVKPRQQIGTQGDVGARGAFHAHIQVLHGEDRTPVNPLRHLFEYHNPGKPVPPLRQFQPGRLSPRIQRGPAPQPLDQGRPAPDRGPGIPPPGATTSPFSPGTVIPGAEGPTSIGGPAGPTPLLSPLRPRSQVLRDLAPTADPALPPLHFAPDPPRNVLPFAMPGLFGEGGLAPAASAVAPFPLEALLSPDRDRALDQWASSLSRRSAAPPAAAAFPDRLGPDQPSAGGLLGMIQDHMRNNAY